MSLEPWGEAFLPSIGSLPIMVAQYNKRHANKTVLCWTGMTATKHNSSYDRRYGSKWCYSHINTHHFQSSLFFTDFQVTLLSLAPAFLQLKSYWSLAVLSPLVLPWTSIGSLVSPVMNQPKHAMYDCKLASLLS